MDEAQLNMDEDQYIEINHKFVRATATSDPETINWWIREITSDFPHPHKVVVGLDIKPNTNPCTKKSKREQPVGTLNLCVGYKCIIIQLSNMDSFPASLTKFLHSMRFTFCGVDVETSVARLEEDCGLVIRSHRDIGEVAMEEFKCLSRCPGVKELARVVAGLSLKKASKGVARSCWAKEELSDAQIENACGCAFAACKIARRLDKKDE